MNIERHFLQTVQELKERIDKGTQYDLVKASGILRQLLIDNPALIDKANERHRLKFVFKTNKFNKVEPSNFVQDGVTWEPVIQVMFVEPKHNDAQFISELNKHQFLKYNIFGFEGHIFTVKDVVKIAANVLGGVHFDSPKTQRDHTLLLANNMIEYADQTSACAQAVKDIAMVTLTGLEPLINKIQEANN